VVGASHRVGGVPDRPTQRAALGRTSADGGAIQRQPDEAGVLEGFVALGPADGLDERLTRLGRVAMLREVSEGIVPEAVPDAEGPAGRGPGQRLDGMEGPLPQHLADELRPEERGGGDARLGPAVTRLRQIGGQPKLAADEPFQAARGWAPHDRRWCRSRTRSSALAVSTSATASLKARPAATRRWTSVTHSAGIHSTRFFPCTMKVKDQSGCPAPCAQWQVGLPHRRWVKASDPGSASAGSASPASSACFRCRSRAAWGPLGLSFILTVLYHTDFHQSKPFLRMRK
jgi:hypothetical protein